MKRLGPEEQKFLLEMLRAGGRLGISLEASATDFIEQLQSDLAACRQLLRDFAKWESMRTSNKEVESAAFAELITRAREIVK